jgi:hypothetical protein
MEQPQEFMLMTSAENAVSEILGSSANLLNAMAGMVLAVSHLIKAIGEHPQTDVKEVISHLFSTASEHLNKAQTTESKVAVMLKALDRCEFLTSDQRIELLNSISKTKLKPTKVKASNRKTVDI